MADYEMRISGAEGYAQAGVPSGDEGEEHSKALPVGSTQVLLHPSLIKSLPPVKHDNIKTALSLDQISEIGPALGHFGV